MAYSYVVYTGNGSTTQFAITFPYIRKEHVKVYVNYVDTAYTYVNDTTVQLAAAPASPLRVEVRRVTPLSTRLVDYTDGSTLVAADLDTSNLQSLYNEQELDDSLKQTVSIDPATGLPSAGGQRITNVGNPTSAQDAATKSYVDTADALKVNKAGDSMSGALAMGTNKITGLGNPTSAQDGATKTYVDTADALKVAKAGDSMTGPLAMGTNKVTGMGNPTSAQDAATKTYVDTADALKVAKAGDSMTGALAMGSNKITGLGTPTANADAATKAYVDAVTLAGNVPDGDRGDITVSGVGTSWTIDTGAVVEAKLGTGAVTSAKILDGTILNADVNATAGIAASKLSFTQAGASAVARTVDSKLKDIVSVKDFGAVGDGVTDDTAAIQAAITYATANLYPVYFPPNAVSQIYLLTAPLIFTGPVGLIGAGTNNVTLWAQGFTAGQYILDFNLPVATNYFFNIEGITLRSNNQAPNGIRLKNTSYCTLRNVQVYNVSKGIVITGSNCFSNYFENFVCYLVANYGVNFESFTGGGHYIFNHCTFSGNYGFGMDSGSGINGLAFTSCNFEQCVTHSVGIIGTVQGLSFVGCRTEGLNGTADFLLYPSAGNEVTGLSVTGCYFTTDAGASVPIFLGGNSGAVRGFNICGNHVEYAAAGNFVTLNGDGESGLIAGNYFNLTTTTPTNVKRSNVVIYANENATGKCAESWGTATWGVEEGTFTPTWVGTTVVGNTTPRNNIGRYTRNGNMVTVWIWGDYLLNSYTTKPTGQVRINNLPFVVASSPAMAYEFPITSTRITHTLPIFGYIADSTSHVLLFEEAANLANDPTAVDWTSVRDPYGQFSLQFSYRI